MLYLQDLIVILSLIFIVINHIITLKQTHLFFNYIFWNISYYFWILTWMRKANKFRIAKVQPSGFAKILVDFLPF